MRLSASLTKLLITFVSHPRELISREQIATALWDEPQNVDVSNGINTAVNRLRATLGDDPGSPVYIETVVGLGYRFIAEVQETPASRGTPLRNSRVQEIPPELPALPTAAAPAPLETHPVISGPALAATVEAGSTSLDSSKEAPSPGEARTWISDGKRRPAKLWYGAALLFLLVTAGLVALLVRASRKSATELAAPPREKIRFVQTTFNDSDDRVTTEALSHSGHMVAFSDNSGISIRTVETGVDRLLGIPKGLRVNRIVWSSDDRNLVVSAEQDPDARLQVWVVPINAEPPRVLLEDAAEGAISPDGAHLAFTRHRGTEIWAAPSSGAMPRRLLQGAEGETFFSLLWAPGGQRLVFEKRRTPSRSETANSVGEAQQRHYDWDYVSIDASTGAVLATQKDMPLDSACLLADGSIIFLRNEIFEDHPRTRLMTAQTDHRTGQILETPQPAGTLPGDIAIALSASDDGAQIAAVVGRRSASVYVADLRFPGPSLVQVRRLVHPAPDNYPHAWTPDGDAVLFESTNSERYAIFKQKLDGSPAVLLARSPGDGVLPQVSPDGNWVLFQNQTDEPQRHTDSIFRVPLKGGKLEQVPTHGTIDTFQCSVSARGRCVVRQTIGKELVYFDLDPVRGQGKELGRTPWLENYFGDWTLSPDGTTVALPVRDPAHPAIRLVTLAPNSPSPVVDIPVGGVGTLIETTWAPDARGFYVECRADVGFALFYVDRSGHATLLRMTSGVVWAVPSRDGEKIAFVDQATNNNVWIGSRNPMLASQSLRSR